MRSATSRPILPLQDAVQTGLTDLHRRAASRGSSRCHVIALHVITATAGDVGVNYGGTQSAGRTQHYSRVAWLGAHARSPCAIIHYTSPRYAVARYASLRHQCTVVLYRQRRCNEYGIGTSLQNSNTDSPLDHYSAKSLRALFAFV